MNEDNYLTNIPELVSDYGFCKVLTVRNEVIHIKHILTEIFVRRTIPIEQMLNKVGYTLFDYMEYMTNRMRRIHKLSRQYIKDCNTIVKHNRNDFFPTLSLLDGFTKTIVLDFDGVVTSNNFRKLYELCVDRENTQICTANPTVNVDWFINRDLPLPNKINAMRGKEKKIKRLIEIQKKYDYVFYVDNETSYLEIAWIFGIETYLWKNNKIVYFSLNSK